MVVPDRRCSRTPGWGPLDSGWKDDAGGWDFGDYGAVGGGGKWGGPDKLGSWTVTMDMKLARFLPPAGRVLCPYCFTEAVWSARLQMSARAAAARRHEQDTILRHSVLCPYCCAADVWSA